MGVLDEVSDLVSAVSPNVNCAVRIPSDQVSLTVVS